MTQIQRVEPSLYIPYGFQRNKIHLRRRYRKPKSKTFYPLVAFTLWLFYASYFAPPGKNYFQRSFWRLSHRGNSEIELLKKGFPVHVGDDRESIDHAGFLLSKQDTLEAVFAGREIPRKLEVPSFWNSSAYGSNGPREFLGSHGKYLITPEEARQIGSYHDGKETIFVAVAAYRDPRCLSTVEDLYSRARYPERIRTAIIDQRKKDDSICKRSTRDCEQEPDHPYCLYQHLIDYIEYSSELMVGPTFARHLTHRMYRGEYFAVQVDSHVRFVVNWDEDIIDQWRRTANEMGVISTYLNDYTEHNIDPYTHENLNPKLSMMCKSSFDWGGEKKHLKYDVQPTAKPLIENSPMMQPFWAAGFSFARGHFIVQVPYDHYLPMVFQGEEVSMTVRAWTYGYDFYAPMRNMAFHMYTNKGKVNEDETPKKENVFTENEVMYPEAKLAAYKRLNGIIGMGRSSTGDYYSLQEEEYGLGQVRSREAFYRIFGIHADGSRIEYGLCEFVRKRMQAEFGPNLRFDSMGIDYSRIRFEYKAPEIVDTIIDPVELQRLRATFKKKTNQGIS
jgi:[Skp1-protein]-hydroxyproline N-acetylglucosaminyltransferase